MVCYHLRLMYNNGKFYNLLTHLVKGVDIKQRLTKQRNLKTATYCFVSRCYVITPCKIAICQG